MDPESVTFTPRDDLWRFQSDMLRVQQNQADLADRVSRLERRHDEDARLKNVWGTSSPFPSVLGGTPQQVPLQHPPSEPFSSFDDHSNSVIGNLHLDADDEPLRRGAASRANSVRFDESANQGWAHASRSSLELISRTGSGMGGHSMSERSYSHKSDGRQSSAGHSVHSATSGRANSLTGYGLNAPLNPPGLAPGLFILGSVPAIIRCWLNMNFKHDSLLYAAICSGSYTSYLDLRLIDKLGFQDQITQGDDQTRKIKLPMYLPEAVPLTSSSRSSSPAPQLPSLSVEFTVVESTDQSGDSKTIQIFLGSDILRAHNADILFSSNQLTLYDDDRSKLQIPLVRPEDDRTFKSLYVTSRAEQQTKQQEAAPNKLSPISHPIPAAEESTPRARQSSATSTADLDNIPSRIGSEDGSSTGRRSLEQRPFLGLNTSRTDPSQGTESTSATSANPRSGTSPAIWSNWRRDDNKANTMDWANAGKTSSSTYQRKDTGMKVLKPLKAPSRTLSGGQTSSPVTGQSRFFDDGRRRTSTTSGSEAGEPQLKRSVSGEKNSASKENVPTLTKKRSANPVGGASAFAWLNSEAQK